MQDTIFIKDLKVETIIGVSSWERQMLQTLKLDIEFTTDFKQAAASDDINFAVDYFTVSNFISEFVAASSFNLIETLAQKIADQVLLKFNNINSIDISIYKVGVVPDCKHVGVRISRSRLT